MNLTKFTEIAHLEPDIVIKLVSWKDLNLVEKLSQKQNEMEQGLYDSSQAFITNFEREILLSIPWNFALYVRSDLRCWLRCVPFQGLWVTHLVSTIEGRFYAGRLLENIIDRAMGCGFNRIWSEVLKVNRPSLVILERIRRNRNLPPESLKSIDNDLMLAELHG